MSNQARRTALFKHLSCFSYASLLAILGAAVPVGTAHGQEIVPYATGTVTCEQLDNEGNVTTVTYEYVQFATGTAAVIGRWGSGFDVVYSDGYSVMETSKKSTTITKYFYAYMPNDGESIYSETGQWQFRFDKNNAVSITGHSYVAKEDQEPRFSAYCTWNLKGTMPTN